MKTHNRNSFFKYVTAEVAKTILANKRLRWSCPFLFDDIYDVTRELAKDIKHPEIQLQAVHYLAQLIKDKKDPLQQLNHSSLVLFALLKILDSKNMLDDAVDKLTKSLFTVVETDSPALSALKTMWEESLHTFRILCLSAANDIPLMWHNYADNYKGVVLEFSCLEQFDPAWSIARPVIYENKPSLLDASGWAKLSTFTPEEGARYLFNESCHTKTTDWAYQQEWRIVSYKDESETLPYSDYSFFPETLMAIHLGSDITTEDKRDIISLLKHDLSHVKIYLGGGFGGEIINQRR